MTDQSSFESELRQFHPVAPSGRVRENLAAALDVPTADPVSNPARLRFADRVFLSTMAMGLVAAMLIVGMFCVDIFAGGSTTMAENGSPSVDAATLAQTREYLTQLAAGKDPFAPPFRP